MLTITYAPGDAAMASRLQQDLQNAFEKGDASQVMIVLISPEANKDKSVQTAIHRALDEGKHVLPLLVKKAPLPDVINHLSAIDLSSDYKPDTITARLLQLSGPGAGLVLKVRTPAVRASNRRAGYLMFTLVAIMFVIGLYMILVVGVEFPEDEYAADHQTETAEVQGIIERYLPRSTQEALDFSGTLTAVPSRTSPLLSDSATATAVARE